LENIKSSQNISYGNYEKFVRLIEKYYSKTVGETRRPINEISLYDYAHTIASLMKSSLAKMVIDGWYEPKGESKWRILKINVDVLGLLSKGLKIGDILGYRNEIEETYKVIKRVVEFEYPLGNEIYRDSTGIYFSCPDANKISKLKSEIVDKLKCLNKLDFSLQIEISDKSRSMVILAREKEESSKRILYPYIGDIENIEKEFEESRNSGGNDICSVCGIRLKSEREDRCKKCKERYEKRAKKWLDESGGSQETIWLDEVADKNDHIALIVGRFGLERWLSGEFVGTFVSQTFDEWKNTLSRRNRNFLEKNTKIRTLNDLEEFFENVFSNKVKLQEKALEILDKLVFIEDKEVAERKQDPRNPNHTITKYNPDKFDMIKHIWQPIIERDATERALACTDNAEKAKHLIKLLFRKHPSPARICRIWETAQEFINETILEGILKEYNWYSEIRRQRIQFKIDPNPGVPEGATCDIDVDGVRFNPVRIDKQSSVFVSTINLEILKKFGDSVDGISKELSGREIKVKVERDRTKNRESFKIIETRLADEKFQNYLPYVKIYDFPDQFMVLVPAYEALDIAEKILEEYETQFSKVRDRLPFHLGIIAFHRKTPLYVVMDAGKRLLEAFKKKTKTKLGEVVSVRDVGDEKLRRSKELEIKAESYSSIPLKWKISYSTGDPDQEDLWHPYIRFHDDISGKGLCFDYTGNGNYVCHIKEIEEGDKIEIEPSYFKLFYLENAADRFRIDEDLKPLDCIHDLKNLWKKIKNKLKSKTWSISQIYAYWEEVKRRRENYDKDTFEKFVRAALTNILEIKPQSKEFNLFFQATVNNILDLCLHWNLQVRKVKIKEE